MSKIDLISDLDLKHKMSFQGLYFYTSMLNGQKDSSIQAASGLTIGLYSSSSCYYRDGKKGWYMVARNLFLLLLNNSGQDQAAVA